jgi:diadenosine tetraphosphatase ApaH/serine/threonine PP2A family protein phosphatase
MRFGILGDVHANLAALQAVLAALEGEGVERYLCLGDLVGYGADPNPCIELVRSLDPVLVGGNHDWAAAGRLSLEYFNEPARAAIRWTRKVVPKADLDWLGSLELTAVLDEHNLTLCHSTLHEPQVFDYLLTPYDAYLSFRDLRTRLGIVGHSHVPVTFFDGNPITFDVGTQVEVAGRRAIANVGSVGQPRDEDPRAAYGVLDTGRGVLRIERVSYDIDATSARIRQEGLPAILGDRLHLGR